MNVQGALRIIDKVLANVKGTRMDHQRLTEAVQVLRLEIAKAKKIETELKKDIKKK